MFDRLRIAAPTRGASRAFAVQRMAVLASLAGIATLTGCGGGSNPVNQGATNPGTAVSLNIAANLPGATQGSAYAGSLTASGGTAPYNFAVTSGQMPQGVNLDATSGNVSGTPSGTGNFNFGVTVSDSKGDSKQQPLQINVAQSQAPSSPPPPSPPPANPPPSNPPSSSPAPSNNGGSNGNQFSNLQRSGGWNQYGQGPPSFVDCSPSPCDGIEFSMTQGISSPSLSGNSTVYWVGGSSPYSDALWNNHLIGDGTSQGMPDDNQSLIPTIHNFTYDVDFYGDNLNLSEALEFDVNQFFGDMGFIFGHECRVANGHQWAIWDNSKGEWISTGVPCNPKSGQWNHLTIKVQRTSDNHETYQSITLNGQTATLNWTFDKGSSPGWFGMTVNFQLDGDYKQDGYKVYLDNLTLTYQ